MLDIIGRFPLYLQMFHPALTVLNRSDDYRIHKQSHCSTLIEFKMLSRIPKSGFPKMGIGLSCGMQHRAPHTAGKGVSVIPLSATRVSIMNRNRPSQRKLTTPDRSSVTKKDCPQENFTPAFPKGGGRHAQVPDHTQ